MTAVETAGALRLPDGWQVPPVGLANLGVTGTRLGMTARQQATFAELIGRATGELGPQVLHHGDCLGADRDAWEIARRFGWRTHCHPGDTGSWRAFTEPNETVEQVLPPLARNRVIVDSCSVLIACPADGDETGGTWFTIRYAAEVGRHTVIVWPDGVPEERNTPTMPRNATHSVICDDGFSVHCCAALTLDDVGRLVDSSAKWTDDDALAAHFAAGRFRWAVAIADEGRAFQRVWAQPLDSDVTFEAVSGAPAAIVLRGLAG